MRNGEIPHSHRCLIGNVCGFLCVIYLEVVVLVDGDLRQTPVMANFMKITVQ